MLTTHDPSLVERALVYSHPELMEHRRLQSLDRGSAKNVSKEKAHPKLS